MREKQAIRLGFLLLVCFLAGLDLARSQDATGTYGGTTQQDASSDNINVFNTDDPSRYGRDFPFMPETDPLSGMPRNEIPPPDFALAPDHPIDMQTERMITGPSKTPGDYDPEQNRTISTYSDISADQPQYSGLTPRDLTLADIGHPIFYTVGNDVKRETIPVSGIFPYIPGSLRQFDKRIPFHRPILETVRFSFDFLTSAAYNDNVFAAKTDKKGDMVYSFAPEIAIEAGSKGFIRLLYAPIFSFYQKYTEFNAANQNVILNLRYPTGKLQLGADVTYSTQKGIFLTSNGQAQQDSYKAVLFGTYTVLPKVSVSMQYEASYFTSNPGGSKIENRVVIGPDYHYSPKTDFGFSVEAGRVDAPVGVQTYEGIQLQGGWRPSYHYSFFGNIGIQARQVDPDLNGQSQLITPLWDLYGIYSPNSTIAYILRTYRKLTTETYGDSTLDIETVVQATFLVRLRHDLELDVRAAAGTVEQLYTNDPGRTDFDFFQGSVVLTYAVRDHLDISIFDNIQQRFHTSNDSEYIANIMGIALTLKF